MKDQAQMQEREQDALDKYPGLMHSIIVEHDENIEGIVLKTRTFQKAAYIFTGDSFKTKVIVASQIEWASEVLGWDIAHKKDGAKYGLIVPHSEVTLYFEIPQDYAKAHQPEEIVHQLSNITPQWTECGELAKNVKSTRTMFEAVNCDRCLKAMFEEGTARPDPGSLKIACDKVSCPDNQGNECQRKHMLALDEKGRCKALDNIGKPEGREYP